MWVGAFTKELSNNNHQTRTAAQDAASSPSAIKWSVELGATLQKQISWCAQPSAEGQPNNNKPVCATQSTPQQPNNNKPAWMPGGRGEIPQGSGFGAEFSKGKLLLLLLTTES